MGRIADAALAILSRGPADVEDIAAVLHADGVTRARNPVAAVRRALRDDARVIDLPDGRLASLAQALRGVDLTTVVDERDVAAGRVAVEPDLAPFLVLGIGTSIDLPPGLHAGELLAVRVEDALTGHLVARAVPDAPRRPDDEAALLDAVEAQLALTPTHPSWPIPPVAHLATVALALTADRDELLRTPGRPLSEVLAAGGYEEHLGWVGLPGTDWGTLTDDEASAMEAEVSSLLVQERTGEAVALQESLLEVLRLHMPERVPAARRRLARALARTGRPDDALMALVSTNPDDPEDWYEAAVIAVRLGDDVRARRWAEAGLARVRDAGDDDAARCLADIAGDLDAQAAFVRAREDLAVLDPGLDPVDSLVADTARISRSYLVEVLMEDLVDLFSPSELATLCDRLADPEEGGDGGRDVCRALAVVAPELITARARAAATARDGAPRSRAVTGLVDAHAVAAWSTLFEDAPDQRQLIIAVAKEDGRVSALIVLIDFEDLSGAVKDAFFLPDMVEERLQREVIAPMEEFGLRCRPIPLEDAVSLVGEGLAITREIGWELPSLGSQPVLQRIRRWVLHPRRIVG